MTASIFSIVYGSRTPDQADKALAELAGAFELGAQLHGGNVSRPGDPGGAFVILLVTALVHIDVAAEEVFIKRVGPLIHRMSRDRGDRAALLRPQRGHLEVLHRDLAQHRFLAGVGLRAKRRAFEHLAGEVSEPCGEALTYRRRRKDGAVAAAAADDDIGAPVQQLDVRVHPGHRHDTVGSAEGRQVERRPSVEPVDRVAPRDLAAQIVLTDLRVEIADAEPRQAVLAGEVLYDADEPVDPAIAAGVGGRPDAHPPA